MTREQNIRAILENVFSQAKDELIDIAVKNIMTLNDWIPVSERLPEEKVAVLVWCPERKNIYCAYLEEKQWWIFGAYFQKVTLDVTEWMPLPKRYEPQKSEIREKNI